MARKPLLRPISVTRGSQDDDSAHWPGSPFSQTFQAKLQDEDADMIIYALMGMQGHVSSDKLRYIIKEKILTLRRFSSVMLYEGGRYVWAASGVEVSDVLREVQDLPGGKDAAMEYANFLFTQPMDLTRTLWEVYILRNATETGDALLFRLHHSLGDGISLASLFVDLVETKDGTELKFPSPRRSRVGSFPEVVRRALSCAWNTLCFIVRLTLLLVIADPVRPMKPKKSVRHLHRSVYGFEIPVDEVKAIGSPVGATVNDTLLAVMGSAMEKFTRKQDKLRLISEAKANGRDFTKEDQAKLQSLEALEPKWRPHALIIANLRMPLTKGEIEGMRNGPESAKWGTIVGYIVGKIPVNRVSSPLDRLKLVKKMMDAAKLSWEPLLSNLLLHVLSMLFGPQLLLRFLTHVTTQATIALSNFPGPQEEVSFAGAKLTSLHQFVTGSPQGCCFHGISYNGKLFVSISTYAPALNAREICELSLEALDDLKVDAGLIGSK